MSVTRRRWLAGASALSASAFAGSSLAIGEGSKLQVAQLKHSGNWDTRPMAGLVLAQEVRFRTSIDVQLKRHTVGALDDRLFSMPLLFMVGDGRFRFSAKERIRLRKWILAGGMLIVDNSGRSEPSESFDTSLRAEMAAIFPSRRLIKIPPQHVLYRSFYVLDFPAGRAIHRTFLEGLFIDDRLAMVYSQNDLMGALDRDRLGAWTFDVIPGGERQREKAKRLAINVMQYAMCLDYKDDQVHLDYLLRRRRWRIKPPVIESR